MKVSGCLIIFSLFSFIPYPGVPFHPAPSIKPVISPSEKNSLDHGISNYVQQSLRSYRAIATSS